MASNFIPMLSSSPPPLDDCPDNEDEDEEFGNFSSANIGFDSSFESPIAGEKYETFKKGENGDVSLNNINYPYKTFKSAPISNSFVLSLSPQNQSKFMTKCQADFENSVIPEQCNNAFLEENESENCCAASQNNVSDISEKCPPDGKCCLEGQGNSQLKMTCSKEVIQPLSDSISNCDESKQSVSTSTIDCVVTTIKTVSKECDLQNITIIKQSKKMPFQIQESVNCDENGFHEAPNLVPGEFSDECGDSVTNADLEFSDGCIADDFSHEFNAFQDACSDGRIGSDTVLNDADNYDTFDAEFDDFQSLKLTKHKDGNELNDFHQNDLNDASNFGDDFDDFQSFDEIGVVTKSSCGITEDSDYAGNNLEVTSVQSIQNSESEDFDDFQGCSEKPESFAEFDAESSQNQGPTDTEEFADFEQASFCSTSEDSFKDTALLTKPVQDKSTDKIFTVIKAIFPPPEDTEEFEVISNLGIEVLEQSNKSRRLWEKLHEIEQTPGLRFQWGVSHSFQQLLRSVNVDYHSILRTSSVPIFASGLSLLEPVKGIASLANTELDSKHQSPRDPIPPVEFDWNSSGLINPLDSGASVLLDLSFLATSGSGPTSVHEDHSLEQELLQPCSDPIATPQSGILEELMSKGVCSSLPSQSGRPSGLSAEANSVLDSLPDLSFMRATVLMFPI